MKIFFLTLIPKTSTTMADKMQNSSRNKFMVANLLQHVKYEHDGISKWNYATHFRIEMYLLRNPTFQLITKTKENMRTCLNCT